MGKYFTIEELCKSDTAKSRGINNIPNQEEINNLEALISNVLDPLREVFGKPIKVNSGYRCEALNKAVGGSKTSHHLKGMAADLTGGSKMWNKQIFELAQKLNLPHCQLIDEKKYSWIHISYDPNNIKRQVLHL